MFLAASIAACEDPRSATEQLEPWVDKTVPLAWQGPRLQDQALVFTTNLEFVVVRKLEQPRTVCTASSGSGGTAVVETQIMGQTEVRLPGEVQTVCEEQDTMDLTRVSRVNVVLKPKRGARRLNPNAIQELVLGYHAKDSLKRTLVEPFFDAEAEAPAPKPALLANLAPSDDTLLALKASGLKLTQLSVRLGDGERFQPGDDISIEATVEPGSASLTTLGSPIALPQFRSAEHSPQGLRADQP